MKTIQSILIATALSACVFPMQAQAQEQAKDTTVNRTVVVEQEYAPDINDATKINVVPQVTPPTVSKKAVEYDARMVPAAQIPATTMQAYTGQETQPKAAPGYVRLGYGNYGNLDAQANYLFSLSSRDRLNLNFGMDGMNGSLDLPDENGEWDAFYYRTRAAIDYLHAFNKVDLNVAGRFGLSNFNLLPALPGNKQKFTSGDFHVGVRSTDEEMPFRFSAETNLMLYQRQHDLPYDDLQETLIRTKAEVTGEISDGQSISVALAMDNVLYQHTDFENYTSLDMNPYYLLQNDDWTLRLGAHVDLAFGFGKTFRAAPDVYAQYNFADSYLLYVQAKGGKQQNDFRRLETICPYGQLASQADATYEQLNAALGFKASPVTGLWMNIYGGYQNLKNDLVQGFGDDALLLYGQNTSNVYFGAEVSYSYKDIFAIAASGTYRNWDTKKDETNPYAEAALLFKPALEADLHVDIRPVSPFLLKLGYQHIARQEVEGQTIDAVSNLYAGLEYKLFKGVSIYARANNLLNQKYQYYLGYPAEGINFVGGVSFCF